MRFKAVLLAVVALPVICSGCDEGPKEPSASMIKFNSLLMSHKANLTDGVSLLDFRTKNRELRAALNQMTLVDGDDLSVERKQSAAWLVDLSLATEKLWSAKVLECEFRAKRGFYWFKLRRDAYCNYVIMDDEEDYWNADRYQRFIDLVDLLGALDTTLGKLNTEGGVISILPEAESVPKHTANIKSSIDRAFSALNFCIDEYVFGRSVADIACGRSGDLWRKMPVTAEAES